MTADTDQIPEDTRPPTAAAKWIGMLNDAKKADERYHDVCDKIDDLYADLAKLADETGDREFQIFWANLEVLKPSIYTRAPVPVVAPRFKDRKPLPRRAADVLERALISDVEADDLHDTLVHARDDLAVNARGAVWLRLGSRDGVPVAIAEHVERRDFRHEPARKWREVGWVARQAFYSRDEAKERFTRAGYMQTLIDAGVEPAEAEARSKHLPGTLTDDLKFEKRKIGDFEGEAKAAVWELWHKAERCVVWVCYGCEYVLDKQDAFLDLTGFFPCPRPAYGTLKRSTLTPVPDFVYYRHQVEEINEHTAKIAALTDALKVRGFYAAGTADVAEAIESAFRKTDPRAILEPVHSMAAMGVAQLKDAIVWLPIEIIAQVIDVLIQQRRVLIEDVYQITGLSDIMRGSTDPNETLGAQQLKSQYGSVRVRERQAEMQRLARDVIRMKAEIMCEEVPIAAMLEMSQVDDIPTQADVAKQAQQIQAQAQQAIMGVVQQAMQPPPMAPQGMSA